MNEKIYIARLKAYKCMLNVCLKCYMHRYYQQSANT